jgi:hypothetical protein
VTALQALGAALWALPILVAFGLAARILGVKEAAAVLAVAVAVVAVTVLGAALMTGALR